MKRIMLSAACAAAFLAFGAAGGAKAQELPVLRVAHVGHDHHLALYVAALESEGLRETWGVHLREQKDREVYDLYDGDRPVARLLFVQTGGGAAMPATMARGEIDIGLGGTAAIARFADRGQPIRIICPLQMDGDQLVMRRGSPVTSWAAFVEAARTGDRPLRIGYKEAMAVAKLILESALVHEGIPYGYEMRPDVGVVLVNFGSESSPFPLVESGVLDGYVMNQPGTAVAVHRGVGQVAAELRDLPPEGKWHYHPCCCIAATETILREQPDAVRTFLMLIHLATDLINREPARAVDVSIRWIRNPREVAEHSIPTSSYRSEPDEAWRQGMRVWHEQVSPLGFFTGRFEDVTAEAFIDGVSALDLCVEAARALRDRGLLTGER